MRALAAEVDRAAATPPPAIWADGPSADDVDRVDQSETLSLWPEEAGLADRLALARDSADEAEGSATRSRAALYRALGHAHDFALEAAADPEGYVELLADAGIKVQARAPMTAVAKLVFGAAYEKTRLTEYAAALSWAARVGVPTGALAARIEGEPGGLKAVVAAERAARRPAVLADRWDELRARLRAAPPLARLALDVDGADPFVLLLARREGDGLAIVAPIADQRMIEKAIRKAA